jgi:hypothetical protein
MSHSSRARPARKSESACSASRSSLPSEASRSILLIETARFEFLEPSSEACGLIAGQFGYGFFNVFNVFEFRHAMPR